MKSMLQVLKRYGVVCVERHDLNRCCYPDDDYGRKEAAKEDIKRAKFEGQAEALEWLVEEGA